MICHLSRSLISHQTGSRRVVQSVPTRILSIWSGEMSGGEVTVEAPKPGNFENYSIKLGTCR